MKKLLFAFILLIISVPFIPIGFICKAVVMGFQQGWNSGEQIIHYCTTDLMRGAPKKENHK